MYTRVDPQFLFGAKTSVFGMVSSQNLSSEWFQAFLFNYFTYTAGIRSTVARDRVDFFFPGSKC